MLLGRGYFEIGKADLRWAVAFTRSAWCSAFVQSGLIVDKRVVAASDGEPQPTGCVYFVLSGSMTIHGDRPVVLEAPAALVLSDEQLDGARGQRRMTFTSVGSPYSAIEVHVAMRDMVVQPDDIPPRLQLDDDVWAAARAVGRLAEHDDDAFRASVEALIPRLVKAGLIVPAAAARMLEPTPKAFALLWQAIRPMVERVYLTPTLTEVREATGLSIRQVDRYVHDFVASFALVGDGWRPATRFIRLKLAAILLSAEGATVADVAHAVGYRSADAMARAFRDAKMMAPTQLQAVVRKNLAAEQDRGASTTP